jgi:predicted O-linked N-acetylglucosamine transferase (SPINDLY family)
VQEAINLRQTGDLAGAEKVLDRAIDLYPQFAPAWSELGDILVDVERPSESLKNLSRALELSRHSGRTLFSLARAYTALEDYAQARAYLKRALQAEPGLKGSATLLSGTIAFREGEWKVAAARATEILSVAPDNLFALGLHIAASERLSDMQAGVQSAGRSLRIRPDNKLHHWMLHRMNFLSEATPELLFEEALSWNALHAAPLARERKPHTNTPDPERRLKIGYLSPDLYNHAIFKNIAPVLMHHDHANYEVFVYSLGAKRDVLTDVIERYAAHFITLPLSRNEIAERIRADGIDLLIDLAGHSMKDDDTYLVYALKPAPVQVSWLGVLATTGLSTMDYFVGGPDFPYPGTEHLFSEKVYRLPRISACYRPIATLPVSDRPSEKNGYITFGSFNAPLKITEDVVKLWSLVMHIVPESRMICKYSDLDNPAVNERIRKWFLQYGIALERIAFEGESPAIEYLDSWGKIDIALDTFPYNGGTTTLDALWCGVPVVALNGRLPVTSGGIGIVRSAGLPFAETPEQYAALALSLAKTTLTEPDIRKRVRQAIASSPLMNEVGLVRAIEAAFRDMWRIWCQTQA